MKECVVHTSYFEACDGSMFLTSGDCMRYEDILKDMRVLKVEANDKIIEFGVMGCGSKYTDFEIMRILFGFMSDATLIEGGAYDVSKVDAYEMQFLLLGEEADMSLLAQSGCVFKDADIIDLQRRLKYLDEALIDWEYDIKVMSDFSDANAVETWAEWVATLESEEDTE